MQRILRDDYKDHCKWFAPVELVRRLLLMILLTVDPGNLVSNWVALCLFSSYFVTKHNVVA